MARYENVKLSNREIAEEIEYASAMIEMAQAVFFSIGNYTKTDNPSITKFYAEQIEDLENAGHFILNEANKHLMDLSDKVYADNAENKADSEKNEKLPAESSTNPGRGFLDNAPGYRAYLEETAAENASLPQSEDDEGDSNA